MHHVCSDIKTSEIVVQLSVYAASPFRGDLKLLNSVPSKQVAEFPVQNSYKDSIFNLLESRYKKDRFFLGTRTYSSFS